MEHAVCMQTAQVDTGIDAARFHATTILCACNVLGDCVFCLWHGQRDFLWHSNCCQCPNEFCRWPLPRECSAQQRRPCTLPGGEHFFVGGSRRNPNNLSSRLLLWFACFWLPTCDRVLLPFGHRFCPEHPFPHWLTPSQKNGCKAHRGPSLASRQPNCATSSPPVASWGPTGAHRLWPLITEVWPPIKP